MIDPKFEKLNKIHFYDIRNWSISAYLNFNENVSRYQQIKIGSFVKRIKQPIDIRDDTYYKRATIKINNGGVFLRDNVLGKSIGTKKQFIISKGQLLLSKIDARNGAFGVVPEELDGGVITGNFWVYEINTSIILPQILCAILSSSKFQEKWDACSNGTTNRHYLQEQDFLNTKIPLPSIFEQTEFISNYNIKVQQARELRYVCDYLEIDNEIEKQLQLNPYNKIKNKTIFSFVNFSSFLSWDVRYRQESVFISSKYRQLPLSRVAQINPSLTKQINDTENVSFVPMECVSDLDGCIKEQRACKAAEKGFTKFQNGDIIWAKITPCMQNGKCAIVDNLINGVGYGSTEFYVIRVNKEIVIPEYVYYLLRMNRVREIAVNYFSGSAGQQRVRKSFLEELNIPIPSIDEQKILVNSLNRLKDKIIESRTKAESLLMKAKQDFENAIFN